MSRINTNISSLQAITRLTRNQNDLATHLQTCTNTLPSATCLLLGLPQGSTYAVGALAVMGRQS